MNQPPHNPYNQPPQQPGYAPQPQQQQPGYAPQQQPPGYAPQQQQPGYGPPQHQQPYPGAPPQPGYAPPQQVGYGPAPGAMPYGAAPGYAQPEYEFTEAQNEVIGKTATWAKGVGIIMFVQAVFALINFNVISAGLDAWIGASFFGGGKALSNVTETQGRDISNMMEALDKLSTAIAIRMWIVLVVVGMVVVFGGLAMVLFVAAAA